MKYKVVKMHRSEFPDPITFCKGEKLIIGEKFDEKEAWVDWYFCTAANQVQGWVPKQVIKWISDAQGEALEDYSAREMDVDEGEVLIAIKALNGWLWCQNTLTKEEGWVPAENTSPI